MKSRTSLKDVAREAGVSTATISRHLNGSLDLPEPTRARIEAAVSKLRYHPNPHARRLSLGKSDTIVLILPDIANPFFAKLAAAIEKAAERHSSMVLLHATFNKRDREMAALERAAQNQVDGVIFITNRAPEAEVAQALNDFARAVILDEDVPGGKVPRVLCVMLRILVVAPIYTAPRPVLKVCAAVWLKTANPPMNPHFSLAITLRLRVAFWPKNSCEMPITRPPFFLDPTS